jgi:uncharacterized membrane-anchored protein
MILEILAIIGAITVVYYVINPIFDVLLFALGYWIAKMMGADWSKVKNHPFKAGQFVLYKWFLEGIGINLDAVGKITQIKMGNRLIWKPYFHYEWIDKK